MSSGSSNPAQRAGGAGQPERPKDRPYTVPQLMSTLYRAIGIDPAMTFPDGSGRPMYVLDDRAPVAELV